METPNLADLGARWTAPGQWQGAGKVGEDKGKGKANIGGEDKGKGKAIDGMEDKGKGKGKECIVGEDDKGNGKGKAIGGCVVPARVRPLPVGRVPNGKGKDIAKAAAFPRYIIRQADVPWGVPKAKEAPRFGKGKAKAQAKAQAVVAAPERDVGELCREFLLEVGHPRPLSSSSSSSLTPPLDG